VYDMSDRANAALFDQLIERSGLKMKWEAEGMAMARAEAQAIAEAIAEAQAKTKELVEENLQDSRVALAMGIPQKEIVQKTGLSIKTIKALSKISRTNAITLKQAQDICDESSARFEQLLELSGEKARIIAEGVAMARTEAIVVAEAIAEAQAKTKELVESKVNVSRNCLAIDMPPEQIVEITGLTIETIETLINP
jgi:hypothetical protein